MFKSFYDKVRIKVACRDPWKVPFHRLMEMEKKLFLLNFKVEGFVQSGGVDPNEDPMDDDLDLEEEEGNNAGDTNVLENKDDELGEGEEAFDDLDQDSRVNNFLGKKAALNFHVPFLSDIPMRFSL